MKLPIYYCFNDEYSTSAFIGEIKHRLLHHPQKGKMEVFISFDTVVKGYSDGKFNVFFYEDDKTKVNDGVYEDNDKKYFVKVNWIQKQRLRWMFGKYWILKEANFKWTVATLIALFALIGAYKSCTQSQSTAQSGYTAPHQNSPKH